MSIGHSHAEGNYTYDTLSNTYYIYPGDTLYYYNGVQGGNWNLCTRNDSVFANLNYVSITDTGTYVFSGGCDHFFEMQTGSIRVEYYQPSAIIEQTNNAETCSATFNHSTQNLIVSYSNMHRQRITYSLYNISGQQILHGGFAPLTGTDQQYNIDLSGNLSGAGMYIMVMETLTDRYTCKLVY